VGGPDRAIGSRVRRGGGAASYVGQGLAGRIRQRYGVRVAASGLLALVAANVGALCADLAGAPAALALPGVDRWDPLVAPDGGPGRYYAELDHRHREALRRAVPDRLDGPREPFRLTARAWYVVGFA
jgi:hypothetical protein